MNRFIESFGNWATITSAIMGKWSSQSLTGSINLNGGRRGGPALQQPSVSGYVLLNNVISSISNGYFGFAFKVNVLPPNVNTTFFVIGESANTNAHLTIQLATTGHINIVRGESRNGSYSAGTLIANTSTAVIVANSWVYFEAFVLIGNTGVGAYDIHINGVSVSNATGTNTQYSSNALFNEYSIGQI